MLCALVCYFHACPRTVHKVKNGIDNKTVTFRLTKHLFSCICIEPVDNPVFSVENSHEIVDNLVPIVDISLQNVENLVETVDNYRFSVDKPVDLGVSRSTGISSSRSTEGQGDGPENWSSIHPLDWQELKTQ